MRLAETLDKHFDVLRMRVTFAMATITQTVSSVAWIVVAALFAIAATVPLLGLGATVAGFAAGRFPAPLAVLLVLATSIGPAFFAAATLAPLFGHWHGRRGGNGTATANDGERAYGLYAAGNAGSFAALLAYPLVIEPTAGLAGQAKIAARLYGVVVMLAIVLGWLTAAAPHRAGRRHGRDVHRDFHDRRGLPIG